MKSSLVVFGGSKGLGKKIVDLASNQDFIKKVISVSRSPLKNKSKKTLDYKMDIIDCKSEEINKFINDFWPLNAICFCQRYRPKSELEISDESLNNINEYKLTVDFIGKFIDQLIQIKDAKKKIEKINPIRILIIGSTYSSQAGLEQNWSYHCTKAAQASLVRYFSIRSCGDFTINMLSPSTFIKEGAENYWQDQQKSSFWNNYSSKGLAKVNQLADASLHYLFNSSNLINGQNINIDNGLSNMYPDQSIDFFH